MATLLEQELMRKQQRHLNSNAQKKESAQLLLQNTEDSRNLQVLRTLGLDKEIRIVEEAEQDTLERQEAFKELGFAILSYEEIKEIGLKYRLVFRDSAKYRGKIPPDLVYSIRRITDKRQIAPNMSDFADHGDFFILAAPQMFVNYQPLIRFGKPKKVVNGGDPILFYRVRGTQYYALVKSWGNNLSVRRAFLGFFTKYPGWFALYTVLIVLSLVCLIPIGWMGLYDLIPDTPNNKSGGPTWWGFLTFLLDVIWFVICVGLGSVIGVFMFGERTNYVDKWSTSGMWK